VPLASLVSAMKRCVAGAAAADRGKLEGHGAGHYWNECGKTDTEDGAFVDF